VTYRRRYRRRLTGGQVAAIAAAVVLLSGAAAGTRTAPAAHGHATGAVAVGGYTQTSWARALLRAGGFRRTPCNVAAVVAWENAEGGHWANAALHNPLNDARPAPGSWLMPGPNPAHVRAYPTWRTGLRATLLTLNGPDYGAIRAALANGNDAQAVADAVATPNPRTGIRWGTEPFSARC
jgi:hypothetical protein